MSRIYTWPIPHESPPHMMQAPHDLVPRSVPYLKKKKLRQHKHTLNTTWSSALTHIASQLQTRPNNGCQRWNERSTYVAILGAHSCGNAPQQFGIDTLHSITKSIVNPVVTRNVWYLAIVRTGYVSWFASSHCTVICDFKPRSSTAIDAPWNSQLE
jgi:hypothetical protein